MIVPGEHALFVSARISRTAASGVGVLAGTVSEMDDRTGLVVLDMTLEHGQASARMALQAFLQTPVPPPDRRTIGRYLAPSTRLAGRSILVVGASRGLGAALAGAFAEQGATVWAAFARSRERGEALRSEFGENRINLLQFDASDRGAAREALEPVRASGGLDGIALCAAPPLHEIWLHPETTEACIGFVDTSFALALVPLAECSDLLRRDGWLTIISTSALDDPPEEWPHYLVAKAALESLAAYCRHHVCARVLVARAPTMWTDSMNTPLGRLTAVPKEQVAAAIVRWTFTEGEAGASRTLLPGDVAALAPKPVSA
jgi:NAD(P)-dependent dehydrogenase (short-subunit alcohol dehydrogenase family)